MPGYTIGTDHIVEDCKFSIGDEVVVSVPEPTLSWGMVSPGEVGTVTDMLFDSYRKKFKLRINFPSQFSWLGFEDELSLVKDSKTRKRINEQPII